MKNGRLIQEVMTSMPHCVEADAKLLMARSLMTRYKVRHLPVTEMGKLFGVISDRDIELALSIAQHVIDESEVSVREVCSSPAYAVHRGEKLDNVAIQMWEHRIGSALVVDEEKIVGIFTASDACRCLGELIRN